MIRDNQVAVVATGIPTGLAKEHLDQIPVHTAVVIAQATGESRHVEDDMTSARNAID
ncbi:hypothetical protein LJR234_002185 [Mesorhizobium amorphae]|uniref:hypothetical protein n=1 Tax=Mesorhizobium amorphae TaxID=71433 RepID=UPI003ECC2A99